MADDLATLHSATKVVAAWRGFAVHAGDIIHGRSHDWKCLAQLRLAVMTLPVLGGDEPNPCRALIVLAGEIAVVADYRVHYDEMHRLSRTVLRRCENAEIGIDLLKGMLGPQEWAA